MRFSVDAHAIGQHLTGNEVYIRNLMSGFAALDHSSEFIAYVSARERDAVAGVPASFVRQQVSSKSFVRLGLDLPRRLRLDRPDLLHVQYTAPLICPVPVVVSVHDVSFLEHPEYFPWLRTVQLRITVDRTVRSAARVITPSEFSRQSIIKAYGLDERKVQAVPIAVSSAFHPISRDLAIGKVQSRFKIPAPFILTVGDLQPRKNQIGLIHAFEALIKSHPNLPHHLAMVGQNTWYAEHVRKAARASSVADRIHFTEFVTDQELLQIYNACELFVFPSFYEGFGLPILEAMACARAVACSNRSAMPEVANAAAILFDPDSIEQMTRAMRDILLNVELRGRMERLGQHRASLFTWERTARQTLDIYYAVAGGKRPSVRRQVKSVSIVRP